MNIKMTPLEIVGLKKDLQRVAQVLRAEGCVHIDELAETPEVSARPLTLDRETLRLQEELSFLVARLEGLIDTMKIDAPGAFPIPLEDDFLETARNSVDKLTTQVQALIDRREKLQSELTSLPRYEATLRKLLPSATPGWRRSACWSAGRISAFWIRSPRMRWT